jgi:hypothetical protein
MKRIEELYRALGKKGASGEDIVTLLNGLEDDKAKAMVKYSYLKELIEDEN